MSLVNQELDQLSTKFRLSTRIGGDTLSQVDSDTVNIGSLQFQPSVNAARPLDDEISANSLSNETSSSESPGCTPRMVARSLRRTKSFNGSSNIDYHPNSCNLNLNTDDEYVMNHEARGLCLIFNHEEFEYVSRRSGTEHDAYCLKRSFEYLGFVVKRYDNLRYSEIIETLHSISRSDHSNSDCFCCCILTHGEGEDLHARDQSYAKHDVFSLFTGENCPTLRGKPKIFFIQACRGTKVDHGVQVDCEHDAVNGLTSIINKVQCIPDRVDFLISYSTVEGYYSYRNVTTGGWFVQSLVPFLEKLGADEDLVSILTKVNRKVAIDFDAHPGKQIPQIVSTLRKKLIFRRKPYPTRQLTRFISGDQQQAQSPNNTLSSSTNNRVDENS